MDADPQAESSKQRPSRNATTKKRKLETEPSGSAAPKPRTNRSTKKGRLAGLLSISLDVVFEILGHLHPLDVLRLSRTSKDFRELLMHKSARPIWRSSLNNVEGMPPCPPHMNEVQWTSLAFDATCQVCQKIARKVDWHLYVRLCGRCVKTCLATPFLADMDLVPTRRDTSRPYLPLHFSPELQKVKTAYNAIKDPEEQQKYAEERKELVEALAQHTKLCETWSENMADTRSAELAGRKEERYTAIVARLTGLGWGTEITNLLPMDSLRKPQTPWNTIEPEMVQYMERMKAKRLAREYAQLVVTRKGMAAKVLRTFKRSQLPWTEVMPGPPDFYEFPKIKDIISQPASVTVDEQTFEALLPDFPGMIATWREGLVQHMVTTYKRGSDANALHPDNVVEDRLKLATSVFKCSSCEDGAALFDDMLSFGLQRRKSCEPLFYPRMIAHWCLTRPSGHSRMLLFLTGELSRDSAWRSNVLRFDTRTSEIVEKVVKACGMDPETATVEDMDASDKRLVCHVCAERGVTAAATDAATSGAPGAAESDPSSTTSGSSTSKDKGKGKAVETAEELEAATVRAYDWRSAVRHHGELHSYFPTAWYMLSDADAAAARALEAVAIEESKKAQTKTEQPEADSDNDVEMQDDNGAPGPSTAGSQNGDEPMEAPVQANTDTDTDTDTTATTPIHPGGPLPSQLPEMAFSCAHCIDNLHDLEPTTLQSMHRHLRTRHDLLTPVLNEDYYRALAAPELYGGGTFPALQLKNVMIALKPDLPSPPPTPFGRMWDHYMGDSDSEMYNSDGDEYYGAFW
ncbi:F-box domain-containing protein [Mycena sanguinolenta]|uniref:F-box domain-containing protein n=1 Tax=Mycena sanguinolenta TaxID=230812 RepID=A0A8H6XBN8_9AGAR|nr:F-box domain-containing protein [Mycena sanguinolenta]